MKDDTLYLLHIIECINRIEEYTAEGQAAFMASTLIQDAVLRNLQIMAESGQRLSAPLKQRYSEVPWRKMAGFRNILVHDYLGIDLATVWDVLAKDLPRLKQQVEAMLEEGG